MTVREDMSFEVLDEGGVLYSVERTPSGSLSAMVRVHGVVVIDGVEYEYDRNVRVALTRLHPAE